MKKDYDKPYLEVITFNIDVSAAGSGPAGGSSEGEVDVDEWYDN